ncbi:MAG: ATP-binding protein, partial [Dissulfurimicrobium sp.]
GLVEIRGDGRGRKTKKINKIGSNLLPSVEYGDDGLHRLLNDISGNEPVSRRISNKVLQFTKILQRNDCKIFLIQDVTETFMAANRLKGQEKLALLGKMSARMAHQIKTPLSVLAGSAQMLARELDDRPDLQKKANGLYMEAESLARQVNEITMFYAGNTAQPILTEICLTLELVKARLENETETAAISVDCPHGIKAFTDPAILSDILFLVGQNALAPEVGAGMVALRAALQNDWIVISIEDDGCGIPAQISQSLFEPFTGTRQGGLGLGLFLAKDLAERIGATLTLKKSGQTGTSFELKLAAACARQDQL